MSHETKITVRFAETDLLGHVNNSSYFIYFEQARIEFFKSLGMKMNRSEWNFILGSVTCDFLSQAYFNQELKIVTTVSGIGNKSFKLLQVVSDVETERVIARGTSAIICFNFQKQQSQPVPPELREKLTMHIEQSEKIKR